MAWSGQLFTVGQILTAVQMNNLQADITALANGDAGAPSIVRAARADPGNLIYISKVIATPVASISMTFSPSTTYRRFVVKINLARTNTSGARILHARLSVNGGSSFYAGATDYIDAGLGASQIALSPAIDVSATPVSHSLDVHITPDSNSTRRSMIWAETVNSNNGTVTQKGGTLVATLSPVNAIQFFFDSGNIDEGEFILYGVENG